MANRMSQLPFGVLLCALAAIFRQLPLSKALVTCTKENGDPIDWFVLYKLPRMAESSSHLLNHGTAYLYWTSDMDAPDADWQLSNSSIDSPDSLPGRTLSSLYSPRPLEEEKLVVMYNDEFPNGTSSSSLGHTKGVLAADSATGFWLIHSVPRFPPSPLESKNYSYPPSATVFGQTMLCVTLPATQFDQIGLQMKYMAPFVYYWMVEKNLRNEVPNLMAAIDRIPIQQPPWSQIQNFYSRSGFVFRSFSKTKQFGKDLYADWIAPALGASLFVETWQNGEGKVMPSDCSNTFTTENIRQVNISSILFKSHKDHSKWAVALDRTNPWICIGDINRMESQKKRGGGSVCFVHIGLWTRFHRGAVVLEPCPVSQSRSSAATIRLNLYMLLCSFVLLWNISSA